MHKKKDLLTNLQRTPQRDQGHYARNFKSWTKHILLLVRPNFFKYIYFIPVMYLKKKITGRSNSFPDSLIAAICSCALVTFTLGLVAPSFSSSSFLPPFSFLPFFPLLGVAALGSLKKVKCHSNTFCHHLSNLKTSLPNPFVWNI